MKLPKIVAVVVLLLALVVQPVWAWDPNGPEAPTDADSAPPPVAANIAVPAVTFTGNNDLLADAIVVPPKGPFPWTLVEDTTSYGTEGSASCVANSGADAWFSFTPVANDVYIFSTFGSAISTVLTLYKGSVGSLTELACDDNYYARVEADLHTISGWPGLTVRPGLSPLAPRCAVLPPRY